MTTAAHEPIRRRGRPATAKATTPTPITFPTPTRFGLAATLEHAVCESLNAAGIPTDAGGWLVLPGQPAEALFGRAVAHLDAALRSQHYGAGYWSAELEPADEGRADGRYRLLIGDAWATTAKAMTFRARSVDFECATVALAGRNAGRRIVRLLAQAAASALVAARAELIH